MVDLQSEVEGEISKTEMLQLMDKCLMRLMRGRAAADGRVLDEADEGERLEGWD